MASPTPQGYSPPVFVAFSHWTNLAPRRSGSYFWAQLCPRPIFGTRRHLAKSRPIPSPADEVGQPHLPRLYPTGFCGLFPLDELGAPAFGRLFFGRGCARRLFLANGGASQSLVPFRFRRTKSAGPTPQGCRPPVFVAFFRWMNLAPGPSGGYFGARLFPRPIFGSWRRLAKSRAIPSPADEVGQPHPPRL